MNQKLCVFLSCILLNGYIFSQRPINSLIETEKRFAAASVSSSTKKAFLLFADSNCIGFNGTVQVNVFKEWAVRSEDSSKLSWSPELAIIASCGDMGVTTGPWEYRKNSLPDTPLAHGHFTTVWMKKNSGEWKAVLDLGIGYEGKIKNKTSIRLLEANKNTSAKDTGQLMGLEKQFIDEFLENEKKAVENALMDNSWFNIAGHQPLKNKTSILSSIKLFSAKKEFIPSGYIFSANRDMFAVYGLMKNDQNEKAYMRIWTNINGSWKLVIMVIN